MRSKDCFYASYYVILCMRLKYIFLFSGFFSCSCMLFGKEKANITLHLTNLPKDSSSSLYISMGAITYYTDSVGLPEAVIKLDVDNPFPVMILANNVLPSNKIFWVHEGSYHVLYDMQTYGIGFKNSPLNEEFTITKGIRDSINYLQKDFNTELWKYMDAAERKKDTVARAKMEAIYKSYANNEMQMNALDNTATEALYQYYTIHPNTFLALDFVSHNFNCGTISTKRLQELFLKLDKSLKKYPLYDACNKYLNDPLVIPLKDSVTVPLAHPH